MEEKVVFDVPDLTSTETEDVVRPFPDFSRTREGSVTSESSIATEHSGSSIGATPLTGPHSTIVDLNPFKLRQRAEKEKLKEQKKQAEHQRTLEREEAKKRRKEEKAENERRHLDTTRVSPSLQDDCS